MVHCHWHREFSSTCLTLQSPLTVLTIQLLIDMVMLLTMLEHPRKPEVEPEPEHSGNYAACVAEQPLQAGVISFPGLSTNGPRPYQSSSYVSQSWSPPSDITIVPAASVISLPVDQDDDDADDNDSTSPTPATEYTPLMASTPGTEHSAMISSQGQSDDGQKPADEVSTLGFYLLLLQQRRLLAGTFVSFTFAVMVSAYDATIPLHVQDIFGWGSFPAGMMFVALQGPGAVFGPICGWLRDR